MKNSKLIKFNKQLHLFQDRIIKEAKKIDSELIKRVNDKDDELDDYEIDLQVSFYLKDDDPDYREDQDNIIAILNDYVKGISLPDYTEFDFRWDETNHCEFQYWDWHEMKDEHHCWLYHCLYDHTSLTWEDIMRIGSFWADIRVKYQYNYEMS